MKDNLLPMCLPRCTFHPEQPMKLAVPHTYEQKFVGTSYKCQYPGCFCSVLFPSKELLEQHEQMKSKTTKK